MKTKNAGKKLVLKKESISMLTREEKWEIHGGVTLSAICTYTITCHTFCVNSQCSIDGNCITSTCPV